MGSIGFQELIIILVIVLIIFGPGKLPELWNTLGKTVRGFRKAMDGGEGDQVSKAAGHGQSRGDRERNGMNRS